MTRRTFLATPVLFAADAPAAPAATHKVCIFSKHLQFLQGVDLARGAAEIGFDGIDLTVRKGGHVEPERVAQDLPPLVKIIHEHGLETPMVTAGIVDADSPFAEDIVKTMAGLGIRNYRWGDLKYNDTEPLAAQLDRMKPRVAKLAALNQKYGVGAMYHTHSGIDLVGASIWDLHILLKDFDPAAVGINYDIGHAVVEGGFGGWINSFRISGRHLRGIAVKDFLWSRNASGIYREQWVPLGEGMVQFPKFFGMVAAADFSGPLQLHFEYPLGGANDGKTKLTLPQDQVFAAMKRDLTKLRGYLDHAVVR